LAIKPYFYFAKVRNLKIENYEVRNGHYLLYGKSDPCLAMPEWDAKNLPLFEGTWLLRNRGLGMLIAGLYFIGREKIPEKNYENFDDSKIEILAKNEAGSLEPDVDFVVRSDGTKTLAADSWNGDLTPEEWVYFADPVVGGGRALFMAQPEDNAIIDSYSSMNGEMTVFGFGREDVNKYLTATPSEFTIGLMDETVYTETSSLIVSMIQPLGVRLGSAEERAVASAWQPFTLYTPMGVPDRNRLVDINDDGRLDAVVGYEAISRIGKLAWYQQPADPESLWSERLIANIIGPMSVDVRDMDGDDDIDVIVGEHNLVNPSTAKMYVFENADGQGASWTEHVVYTGDEHHDGAQVVDIDGDNDLDIVSIGWGNDKVILYENLSNCDPGGGPPPANQPPTANAGADQTATDSDDDGVETVTLNGTGSRDNDGSIVSYQWSSNTGVTIPDGVNPTVSFLVGSHTVTLRVTDDKGATDTDTVVVTVNALATSNPRVTDGLVALYTFDEGSGNTVNDISGVGQPLPLAITVPGNVTWMSGGGLRVNSETRIMSSGPATKIINTCRAANELTVQQICHPKQHF